MLIRPVSNRLVTWHHCQHLLDGRLNPRRQGEICYRFMWFWEFAPCKTLRLPNRKNPESLNHWICQLLIVMVNILHDSQRNVLNSHEFLQDKVQLLKQLRSNSLTWYPQCITKSCTKMTHVFTLPPCKIIFFSLRLSRNWNSISIQNSTDTRTENSLR